MLVSCQDLQKQCLADNHPVLAADNVNLDIAENEIMEFFYRRHKLGTTFVIVTHNSTLAHGHKALRVLHMNNGRLQEQ